MLGEPQPPEGRAVFRASRRRSAAPRAPPRLRCTPGAVRPSPGAAPRRGGRRVNRGERRRRGGGGGRRGGERSGAQRAVLGARRRRRRRERGARQRADAGEEGGGQPAPPPRRRCRAELSREAEPRSCGRRRSGGCSAAGFQAGGGCVDYPAVSRGAPRRRRAAAERRGAVRCGE